MIDFRLLRNDLITLPRFMDSNSCFSIADVFLPWLCVNSRLNAPDDQLIEYVWFAAPGLLTHMEAVRVYVVFHT